ncbi:extragenic suppressor protein SuhB [Salmonella enterica subsp. arizonae]|uniref:Extragenic suppressor protein SuhB n=1 Tax=Salmonella enterica subsp. arizonae TaxID=59203 RepID=A0A447R0A2_SALER|nr:extragenic suppressor protein SuhB [Salmonella enterica subsp. arizonae]
MHPMLTIAVRAARKAGNVIAKNYETPDAVEASQKGSNDFVTNVDKAAEAIIIDTIRKSTRNTQLSPKKAVNTLAQIRMSMGYRSTGWHH